MVFLNETGAEVAIISVGAGNTYGHPARETLARLQAAGMQVFRTDRDGTLVIREQTPTPTATPTSTPATTSTPTEVAISSVAIGDIRCETREEYVRIDNEGSASQDLTDWRIQSYESTDSGCVPAGQWYTFPTGYVLDAGASVYVHSGPDAANNPPTDLKWVGSYVWHNDGDVAVLYDAAGAVIDTYCYGECCP